MASGTIAFHLENRVATITLDSPEAGNALDSVMADRLADACARVDQDDDIRVAVVRGAGASFCAGEVPGLPSGSLEPLAALAKPVIACVNGDALGAGLELALACDIRIAAQGARFGFPGLRSGAMPHNGGTQRLPRIVGRAKALEMLLTEAMVDAPEAARVGLVARLAPAAELGTVVQALALKMADMAPYSLRFAKETINKGLDLTMGQGLRLEADLYFLMHTTHDRVEGITSYLQKRTPHFEGR